MARDKQYLVTWEIDIEASTPLEAAKAALKIHRDPESIATVFEVRNKLTGKSVSVDLGQRASSTLPRKFYARASET